MSSSSATDTTPLLGTVPGNAGSNRAIKRRGIRQHLLDMTPLQSFISLIVLAAVVFTGVYLMLKYNLPKDLTDDQRQWIKFPRSAEDVQQLSKVLNDYLSNHYYNVLFCFIVTYLSLQSFAVPGTAMLSVLAGALFQFWVGFITVLCCCGFGALSAYTISYYLGHPIVEKYLSARIDMLEEKIEARKDDLFFYFAFLRVTPFVPIGVLPNCLVTVQAGVTLAALANPDDFTLLTPQNIIMTVIVCACLLLPIVLHRHAEDPTADTKPNTDEENAH
ncbi:Transmembrane protein 41B [Mortierella sp. GBA30]|nr:Transmembrane protein 41B [Mortierella sp. GBA30]